jgi:hypothetical protein
VLEFMKEKRVNSAPGRVKRLTRNPTGTSIRGLTGVNRSANEASTVCLRRTC